WAEALPARRTPRSLLQYRRHAEIVFLAGGRIRKDFLGGERGAWGVGPHDVVERDDLRRGRNGRGIEPLQHLHVAEDLVQLGAQPLALFLAQPQPRQIGYVVHVLAANGHAATSLMGSAQYVGSRL